jgi:transcriptional regulator with XRE-family HTH domain
MSQRNNTQLQKLIAQRIKELRVLKKVSQQQVYNDTDVHVGRLEAAKINATVNTIAVLCDYFDISLPLFFKDFPNSFEPSEKET